MSVYTIVAGVDGVGKSSLIGALGCCIADLGPIIDVNTISAQQSKGAIEGDKIEIHMVDECIANGVSFTQETTLSDHRIAYTVQRVKGLGYYVRLYYVGLDTVDESKQRIENRIAHGVHNACAGDVERCFLHRWEAVKTVLPYCDEAVFYDNDNGFVQVATYRNGELIPEGDYRPQWLCELADSLGQL